MYSIYLRVFLHTVILVLITLKVLDWNISNASYSRSCRQTFEQLFLGNILPLYDSDKYNEIFTFQDMQKSLDRMLYVYRHLEQLSTTQLLYGKNTGNCTQEPDVIIATTSYWTVNKRLSSYQTELYNMSSVDFIFQDVQNYFDTLHSVQLSFYLCHVENHASYNSKYNTWKVDVHYVFESQVFMDASLDATLIKSQSSPGDNTDLQDEANDFIIYIEIFLVLFNLVYIFFILQVSVVF